MVMLVVGLINNLANCFEIMICVYVFVEDWNPKFVTVTDLLENGSWHFRKITKIHTVKARIALAVYQLSWFFFPRTTSCSLSFRFTSFCAYHCLYLHCHHPSLHQFSFHQA